MCVVNWRKLSNSMQRPQQVDQIKTAGTKNLSKKVLKRSQKVMPSSRIARVNCLLVPHLETEESVVIPTYKLSPKTWALSRVTSYTSHRHLWCTDRPLRTELSNYWALERKHHAFTQADSKLSHRSNPVTMYKLTTAGPLPSTICN